MSQSPISSEAPTRVFPIWAAAAVLSLPWLNPYTAGPSPSMWPWLISAACLITLWILRPKVCASVLARSCLAAGCVSAVIGLVQYGGFSHWLSPWISQTGLGEAFGNLRQRNQFASLMNLAFVGAVFGARQAEGTTSVGHRSGHLIFLGIGLLQLGNAASSSRTGLLELLLVCVLCWYWGRSQAAIARRWVMRAVVVALVAYFIGVVLLPWLIGFDLSGYGVAARLKSGDPVCTSRLTLWSNVLHLIAQRPWFGWGWGELDYAHFITLYSGPRFCDILDNAHNLPLHLAVELGLPVAVAACVAAAWLVWRSKPWLEVMPSRRMAWAMLSVIALHSMLEYPLWYGPFQIVALLCIVVLATSAKAPALPIVKNEHQISSDPTGRYWSGARMTLACAGLVMLSLVGLDYFRISQIYLPDAQRSHAYKGDTLNKIRDSRFFANQVQFAELSMTTLTRENASTQYSAAQRLLHFSPEPRVIERLIESSVMLGREDEALFYLIRYREAFPEDHAKWAKNHHLL